MFKKTMFFVVLVLAASIGLNIYNYFHSRSIGNKAAEATISKKGLDSKPSIDDIKNAVLMTKNLSPGDVRQNLNITKVKVVALQYGNQDPDDGRYPIRVYSLVGEDRYGELYLYQEFQFHRSTPDYGEPRWESEETAGMSSLARETKAEDFFKTPIGHGLELQ